MSKLVRLNDINDLSILDEIFENEITVFEDVQGSKIYVNWDGEKFNIRPKSMSSDPINLIDLALQNYYNHAINYLNKLDDRVKGLLNKSWSFCFEYFPDNQPANIEYNRVPKNNLVLTSICKKIKDDNKGFKKLQYSYSIEELDEYARLLDVDMIPIIFKGKINEKTKEAIKYFLHTSENDLEYVFGEQSFAFFFFKILNPQLNNSFLMDDDFQRNMEKIIIRVNDKETSFELLNPLYNRVSNTNSTEFVEVYSLILINFLNFCQSINLESLKLKGYRKEEIYINYICSIFNKYISEVKDDLLNFDFIIPSFFDKDKFRINKELISNKTTKQFINEEDKLEYIFKCILGSFNKKRKHPIGVFTKETINIFNKFVDYIDSTINGFLKKKDEIELAKDKLLDFGDFFDIKYDTDSEGEVYPDIYTEFEKGIPKSKKGVKKDKFK